jgi:DNA polymerase-1
VHDALLIAAPIGEVKGAVAVTREAMAEASGGVLGGFEVCTEAKITRYPNRFTDARGTRMWSTITQLIEEAAAEGEATARGGRAVA